MMNGESYNSCAEEIEPCFANLGNNMKLPIRPTTPLTNLLPFSKKLDIAKTRIMNIK